MKKTFLKIAALTILTAAILCPSPSRAADETTNGPAKFYGPVTAVDTNKMTFTVGEQTFSITPESQVTKSNKTATIADAVVGEPARGSYVKAKDGKLEITKVRFGKKPGGGKAGGKKNKKTDATDSSAPSGTPKNN